MAREASDCSSGRASDRIPGERPSGRLEGQGPVITGILVLIAAALGIFLAVVFGRERDRKVAQLGLFHRIAAPHRLAVLEPRSPSGLPLPPTIAGAVGGRRVRIAEAVDRDEALEPYAARFTELAGETGPRLQGAGLGEFTSLVVESPGGSEYLIVRDHRPVPGESFALCTRVLPAEAEGTVRATFPAALEHALHDAIVDQTFRSFAHLEGTYVLVVTERIEDEVRARRIADILAALLAIDEAA